MQVATIPCEEAKMQSKLLAQLGPWLKRAPWHICSGFARTHLLHPFSVDEWLAGYFWGFIAQLAIKESLVKRKHPCDGSIFSAKCSCVNATNTIASGTWK